jgi:hypothetical protein
MVQQKVCSIVISSHQLTNNIKQVSPPVLASSCYDLTLGILTRVSAIPNAYHSHSLTSLAVLDNLDVLALKNKKPRKTKAIVANDESDSEAQFGSDSEEEVPVPMAKGKGKANGTL